MKNMKAIFLFFFFFLTGAILHVHAQKNKGEPNELDKLYIPTQNSVFNPGKSSTKNSSPSENNNAIKFNPVLLTRSIGALFYEKWLSDEISVQGGLGICYNKDIMMGKLSEIQREFNFSRDATSSFNISDIMLRGEFSSGSTPFISFAFRFFGSGYYDSESYFELNFRYYSNTLKIPDATESYNKRVLDLPEVTVRNFNYLLTYGYQVYTSGKIRTSHDFYYGIGLRNTSYDSFREEKM